MSVTAVGFGAAGIALFFARRMFGHHDTVLDEDSSGPIEFTSAGHGKERRTAPRRRGNYVAAHLSDDSGAAPAEVWVVDRSLGGLCLLAEAPVKPGSQLRVRPRHASGSQQWTPVRVCACTQDRNRWLLHCQFLQIPPMNVLLLYG